MFRALTLLSLSLIMVALQGCAAGVVGGAVAGASLIYDRRTTGTVIEDQSIEFKVIDAMRGERELWEQVHVNATSYNQVVLLTGEAPREELRTRVGTLASGIPKVRKVHNELVVAAPSSLVARSGDTWITGKVKTNMLAAQQVDAGRVKVVTEGGTVYLLGLVTRAEADAATDVARKVSGVQRVVKMFEYID